MTVSVNQGANVKGVDVALAIGIGNPFPEASDFYFKKGGNSKAVLCVEGFEVQCQLMFPALGLLVAGQVSSTSAEVAGNHIKASFKEMEKYYVVVKAPEASEASISNINDYKDSVMKHIKAGQMVKAIKELRNQTGMTLKDAKLQVEAWQKEGMDTPIAPIGAGPTEGDKLVEALVAAAVSAPVGFESQALQMEQTKLKVATKVGQPVDGTDSTSTYHCIARGILNVAVRIYESWNMSIRAELADKPDTPTESQQVVITQDMVEAGWVKNSAGHLSLHLDCNSKLDCQMSIGALLMSTGVEFEECLQQPVVLAGMGK